MAFERMVSHSLAQCPRVGLEHFFMVVLNSVVFGFDCSKTLLQVENLIPRQSFVSYGKEGRFPPTSLCASWAG